MWPIILIIIGALLILWEIFEPGFFIAVPGTVLIIYGFILLAAPWIINTWWGPWLLVLLAFPIGGLTYFFYRRISPPSPPVTESYEGLIGKTGIVIKTIRPDSIEGKVRIGSDVWSATSDTIIDPGIRVKVVGVEGVHLIVKPIWRADEEEKT